MISGDQGSPATSSVRAIEQAMSPNRVLCMWIHRLLPLRKQLW
jgi:hypothetical protein